MERSPNPDTGTIGVSDLHCHLLPDWDDGPKTFDDSLRLARRALEGGTSRIVVTPHVGKASLADGERPASEIAAATALLEQQLRDHGVAITLVPGAEIMLSDSGIVARIAAEPCLTYGGQGKYVLVETPMRSWPHHIDRTLFEIGLQGVTPILAHPERIGEFHRDLSIARGLASRGVLLQITARTLIAERANADTMACSRAMLENGLVAIVASDAHSSRSVFPGEVEKELSALVGPKAANILLVENPRRVLAGEQTLPYEPEVQQGKTNMWRRMRGLVGH